MKNKLENIICEFIGEDYTLPYERKSPFPSEGVEYHLRTYGHLPEKNCCRHDQFVKEDVEVANETLADLRSKSPQLVEDIVKMVVEEIEKRKNNVTHTHMGACFDCAKDGVLDEIINSLTK